MTEPAGPDVPQPPAEPEAPEALRVPEAPEALGVPEVPEASRVPDATEVAQRIEGEPIGEWQRLHPISPFLRGGVMVLAVGGYLISQQLENLIGIRMGPESPDPTEFGFGVLWIALAGFLALVALVVLYGWVSWRVSRFRIGESLLEYRWGILFKQHRQVRYDRIQSVDISRPILARLFGLSQVVVQSAGGSDSQVQLAYLTHTKALHARDAVLSLVDAEEGGPLAGETGAGVAEVSDAYQPQRLEASLRGEIAPTRGREVLRTMKVPMGRFIASLLYHPITVLVLITVPGALIGSFVFPIAALPILVPVFFGAVLPHASRFLKEANFSVDVESDRLRITHGLTDQRSNTVPLARIQAVEISQGVFWRFPDWWRLKVTIAGVAGGEDTDSQTTAFPVGTEDEVLSLAETMLPGLDRDAIRVGMRGTGGEPGFTGSSRRSRVFQPWAWHRNGYAVTETALVIRRGWLARVVSLVPHARVQSMSLSQGPLDRWREVATVQLDLTDGPVSGVVPHLDAAQARQLLVEQSSRSALARTVLQRRLPLEAATELDIAGGPGQPAGPVTEGSAES